MAKNVREMLEQDFLNRGNKIQAEIDEKYGSLTERERRLMREAAVSAWVAALQHHGVWGAEVPKDSEMLNAALWVCHSNERLYPIFMDYTPEDEDS